MIDLNKENGSFTILNLTDPQLSPAEWAEGHKGQEILRYTARELIERVKPDLITVSGDISWGEGCEEAYARFGELMEEYATYWAVVWGNHDNEDGDEVVERIADSYLSLPHFCYEKGPKELGNGNYVILLRENGKAIYALFMMDTHANHDLHLLDRECKPFTVDSYASLTPAQLAWYEEQAAALKEMGVRDSALIVHIPLYGYRKAFYAATEEALRAPGKVGLEESYRGIGWKDGYKDSCFGVNREGIASPGYDDGVLEILKKHDLTHQVIAGHEHVNNFSIPLDGIRLTYATKIGPGCYWNPDLNGGTVLTVDKTGAKLRHEYVDVSHLL